MTEIEAIEMVSDRFRRDGYTVVARDESTLATLSDLGFVDLIATQDDQIFGIIIKRDGLILDDPVVVDLSHHSEDHSLSLLAEAEKLRGPQTRRAAFLMAYTAFEAAAREILAADTAPDDQGGSLQLIEKLVRGGVIDDSTAKRLRRMTIWKDLLTHNVRSSEIAADWVTLLLDTVRKLKTRQLEDRFNEAGATIMPMVIRPNLGRDDRVAYSIIKLSPLFDEVLGPSCPEVLADWDQASDEEGEMKIILKLSDFHGSVSGVFTRDELARPLQFRSRLNQLWSRLLQFRIDHLLAKLTA